VKAVKELSPASLDPHLKALEVLVSSRRQSREEWLTLRTEFGAEAWMPPMVLPKKANRAV